MKFQYRQACQCGGQFLFTTSGDDPFSSGTCSSCGASAHLIDPLSVSVVAERLLVRSKAELDGGDYSLAILLAAISVETFLTRLFMKLRGMQFLGSHFEWPSEHDEILWESEYPRSGGFQSSANFVSKLLVNMTFDSFVSANPQAREVFDALFNPMSLALSELAQVDLFKLRNRIAHWGYVNAKEEEARRGYEIGRVIVTILREMDRVRYASV